jgi:hypothetical protein
MNVFYIMRSLEGDAADWVAAGWSDVAFDCIPSLAEAIVLVEWHGDKKPPVPEVRG